MEKAKVKAGFIGIIGREGDKWAQLEQAAKIGFKGTENAEMYMRGEDGNIDPENVKRFKDLGMSPITVSSFNGPALKEAGADSLIKRAHAIGVDKAVMFHGAAYYKKDPARTVTYDDVMTEIEMLQNVSAALKKEGIKLGYHNHDHEFELSFNGLTVFDMLLAYAPDLCVELDVGWATYAGQDPVKLMKKLGDRLSAVHFKDFVPNGPVNAFVPMIQKEVPMPNFSSVGSGGIAVHALLETCYDMGIEYAICEQDFMHVLTPLEVLQTNYLVMKETGFLE